MAIQIRNVMTPVNVSGTGFQQPLYDTEVWSQTAPFTPISFFTRPLGTSMTYQGLTRNKNDWWTNLQSPSQLPAGVMIIMAGFALELEPGMRDTDVMNFERTATFYWFDNQTIRLQVPVSRLPGGLGMDGFGAGVNRPRKGQALPIIYDVRIPREIRGPGEGWPVIQPLQNFHCELRFEGPFTAAYCQPYQDVYVRCYINGVMVKPLG